MLLTKNAAKYRARRLRALSAAAVIAAFIFILAASFNGSLMLWAHGLALFLVAMLLGMTAHDTFPEGLLGGVL